jgi:hypothetical protein
MGMMDLMYKNEIVSESDDLHALSNWIFQLLCGFNLTMKKGFVFQFL